MIKLSQAGPADVADIAALVSEMNRFYGSAQPEPADVCEQQITEALFREPPAGSVLLARDEDGRLAGFASYSFLWPAAGLTTALHLKDLYVAAGGRHRGVGSMLMRELFVIAAERGCSRVEWTADADNEGARAFYEAMGVSPTTSRLMYRIDGEDLLTQDHWRDVPG